MFVIGKYPAASTASQIPHQLFEQAIFILLFSNTLSYEREKAIGKMKETKIIKQRKVNKKVKTVAKKQKRKFCTKDKTKQSNKHTYFLSNYQTKEQNRDKERNETKKET